jgi:NADP-dependent aldehyde dehydrogenase
VGERLVRHPGIQAVGFTGSFAGGSALLERARERAAPIPVYAEMGSVNPVTVLPAALAARGAAIGRTLAASVLNGVGQFCTCPGLLAVVRGPGFEAFRQALAEALAAAEPGAMLGERLAGGYRQALEHWRVAGAVGAFPQRQAGPGQAAAALLEAPARALLATPALAEEAFGPAALLVPCADEAERRAVLEALPGQLTATVWMDAGDAALARALLPLLRARAGRVLFNGVPTGVEVGHAMVHGGPWPATSAPSSTSVGTRAIRRWARPVCYQDAPEELLPAPLRSANPLGILRWRDGAEGRS